MTIAQIHAGRVHHLFEAEEIPNWPPDSMGRPIVLIDATNVEGIEAGWDYNAETGDFTAPVIPEPEPAPVPEPTQSDRIEANTDYVVMMLG